MVEIRNLQPEDHKSLLPLIVGTNSVIWPRQNFDVAYRQLHCLAFELSNRCDSLGMLEKWEKVRQFFFEKKEFRVIAASWSEMREEDLLLKPILENQVGHPLPVTLLFLHLAQAVGLPVSLVHARQQFIVSLCTNGNELSRHSPKWTTSVGLRSLSDHAEGDIELGGVGLARDL